MSEQAQSALPLRVKLRKTQYEQMFFAVPAKADIAEGISKAYRFTLTMPESNPSLAVHCRGRDRSPIRRAQRGMVKRRAGRGAISAGLLAGLACRFQI
jgi:hypothetical protein